MTKEDILTQLREAKTAHVQWLSGALALVSGAAAEPEHVPVQHTQCAFGKWYYGGGTRLSRLSAYKAIDVAHEDLHHTYAEIYQTLFIEQRRPWPLRLLARRPLLKLSQSTQNDALIERLIAASKRLLESIAC